MKAKVKYQQEQIEKAFAANKAEEPIAVQEQIIEDKLLPPQNTQELEQESTAVQSSQESHVQEGVYEEIADESVEEDEEKENSQLHNLQ